MRVLGKRLPSAPTMELTKPPDVVSTTSSTTAGVGLTGRSDGLVVPNSCLYAAVIASLRDLRSGPVDHPAAHLFGRRLDRPSAAHRALAGSSGGDRCCWGVCEDTYLKKEKRVVQWSSGPATSEVGATTVRNRTYRRFRAGGLWTTPPGPRWSSLVQGGPGWSTPRSEQRGGAWLGRAAGLNRSSRERCASAFRVDRAGSQAQRGSAAR